MPAPPQPEIATAEVVGVVRLSPTFVRITFGGDGLDRIGTPGHVFDARIRLIFPSSSGRLPQLAGATWMADYRALPDPERGPMRTYSIRALRADAAGTRIDVDFVLHLEPDRTGPATRWASAARPGDRILLAGPRRDDRRAGIEFAPGPHDAVVLAGDETAAPAIARILEDAPATVRGVALIEVPSADDVLSIAHPAGVDVRWLPRDGAPHGRALMDAVLAHLGDHPVALDIVDIDGDETAWETRIYSRTGQTLDDDGGPAGDRYFWIAGESAIVTTLRRHLVDRHAVPRSQLALMGYWKASRPAG
ncbi:siderophore-interacting protein [Microbacterium gilvum]|uniref:siderophore-interacting protein n=1 Tax=Microbacterium gilvum TaxID=1336204 RepID=UPI0031EACDE6